MSVIPSTRDRDSLPFWEAARSRRAGRAACAARRATCCTSRGATATAATASTSRGGRSPGAGPCTPGRSVEHAVDPAFPAPYTIVLVELDDEPGVRFVTDLPGRPELAVGLPMVVRFDRLADGRRRCHVGSWRRERGRRSRHRARPRHRLRGGGRRAPRRGDVLERPRADPRAPRRRHRLGAPRLLRTWRRSTRRPSPTSRPCTSSTRRTTRGSGAGSTDGSRRSGPRRRGGR